MYVNAGSKLNSDPWVC